MNKRKEMWREAARREEKGTNLVVLVVIILMVLMLVAVVTVARLGGTSRQKIRDTCLKAGYADGYKQIEGGLFCYRVSIDGQHTDYLRYDSLGQ